MARHPFKARAFEASALKAPVRDSVVFKGLVFLGLALAVPACAGPARAADWPARPIRIIAPSTPGGAADSFARLLAEFLPPLLHQPLIVDNRAGGGGLIGTAAAARAEADGYTLVTSSVAYLAIAPAVSANAPFDPVHDFTHVAFLGGPPNAFVAYPSAHLNALGDLLALARSRPPLNYVSPGVGTLSHLLVEYFAQKAGIAVQHIPHKGSAQAIMDLVAGNVPIGSMTWSSAAGQVRAGTVAALAVSSAARIAQMPDVPTLRESGFDDLVATTWYALSGPAGLPGEVVATLNRAVNAAWAMPAVRRRLDDDAVAAEPMSPAQVTAFVAREVQKWGPVSQRVMAPP